MKKRTKIGMSLLSLFILASCQNKPSQSVNPPSEAPVSQPVSSKPSDTPKPSVTPSVTPSVSVAEEFAITIDAGEGATIVGLPEKAKEGQKVTFTIELEDRKVISYVTIDGENVLTPDKKDVYSFVRPKRAVTVTAVTEDERFENNVIQVEGATVAVSSTYAKFMDIIDVRVTISDETKVSPVVKADGDEIQRTLVGDKANKTFTGHFRQPGKDIDIITTLVDAPAKYAIVDKSGDGTIVKGPSAASQGETVTFSLGLEEGFEFDGAAKVYKQGDEETVVDVTKNDDGTYSFVRPDYAVVIERKTTASVFKINVQGDSDKIKDSAVTCPEYAVYGSKVSLTVKDNESYLVDKVLVDGNEAVLEDDGSYSFIRPTHAVTVKVVSKVHYYPIKLENSNHITLSAFTKNDETGAYEPVGVFGVTYSQHVYIKATATSEDGVDYDVDEMRYSFDDTSSGTVRKKNADGYYESTSPRGDYGRRFTVTEGACILKADSILVGSHAGFNRGSSYTNNSTLTLNRLGKGTLGYSDVSVKNLDETKKTFSLESGSSTYASGYTDSGLIYVNQNYSSSSQYRYNLYFYLSGASSLSKKTVLWDNSSSYSVNKALVEIGSGDRTVYALATKPSYGAITVKEVSVVRKKENSIDTKGAVFQLREGTTSVGYFQNKDGLLATYDYVAPATYKGYLGDITTDGFGKATLTKDGESKEGTYTLTGNNRVLLVDGTYSFVKIDGESYTKLNYVRGSFYGKNIESSTSSSSVSQWYLTSDFKSKSSSSASYEYPGSFDSDGNFVSNGYTICSISPDEKAFVRKYGTSVYSLFSSDPDAAYDSHRNFAAIGDDTSFVGTISGTSSTKVVSSVYFDGTSFHWGTISSSDFDKDGTSFTFTEGENVYNLYNNNGKVVVPDAVAGTYANDTLGALVLNGNGTGTLAGSAITYAINEDGTITVTAGEKTYIVTLGEGSYTYQEKVESLVPEWLAGKTFYGYQAISIYDEEYYDSTYYDRYIVFSATELKLSTSAGSGASASKPLGGSYLNTSDAAYTIDGTTLTVSIKGYIVKFSLNEEKQTIGFITTSDIAGLTPTGSATFKIVA